MSIKGLSVTTRAPDQLGLAIKRARKALGLTQADLAKKTGIQQRTISKVETGQTTTELKTIYALCSALGVELILSTKTKAKRPKWMSE